MSPPYFPFPSAIFHRSATEVVLFSEKEIDLNDSRGLEGIVEQSWPKQNEEPAQLKYEEKSTLQDACKEKQAWGSQSVNILKMNIVLASKEVVADSLGSCSQHQLKLMISGLTSHSEVVS